MLVTKRMPSYALAGWLACAAALCAACGEGPSVRASFSITLDAPAPAPNVAGEGGGRAPQSSPADGSASHPAPPAPLGGSGGGGPAASAPGPSIAIATGGAYSIVRVAGDELGGLELGVDPLTARLRQVAGLVTTPDGTLYVCDPLSHQIRAIPPAGASFVVAGAGDGSAGYLGDQLPAVATRLDGPVGLAREGLSGALFVCDSNNHRIRFFVPGGRIYTYAGGGADAGDVVARATEAALARPFGLALDGAGNVFFTERDSGRVRQVDRTGRLMTLATLTPGRVGPIAVSLEGDRVWVGDGDAVRLLLPGAASPLQADPVGREADTVVTGLAYDQLGRLFVSRTAAAPFGLRSTAVLSLRVDATGRPLADAPQRVAGAPDAGATPASYSVPTAEVADAGAQPLAGAGYCALYLDQHHADAPDVLSGLLLIGNSYADAAGLPWAQVARLTPRP